MDGVDDARTRPRDVQRLALSRALAQAFRWVAAWANRPAGGWAAAGRPGGRNMPGELGGELGGQGLAGRAAHLRTNVPRPGTIVTRPSSASSLYARRIVIGDRPVSAVICVIGGSFVPGGYSPEAIRSRISAASWR